MDQDCDLDLKAELDARRTRLRALADRVLEAMEALPLPETHLQAAQAQRAIEITDRMMTQLYSEPSLKSYHPRQQTLGARKRSPHQRSRLSPSPQRRAYPSQTPKPKSDHDQTPQDLEDSTPQSVNAYDPSDYQAMTRGLLAQWMTEGSLVLPPEFADLIPKPKTVTPDQALSSTDPP